MDLASVVAALTSVGVRVSGSTPNNNIQGDSSRACPTGLAGPEPSGTLNDPGQHFQWGVRVGCSGGVFGWGVRVGCSGGAFGWGGRVGRSGGAFGWGVRAGCSGGVFGWGVRVGCSGGVFGWGVRVGCSGGVFGWDVRVGCSGGVFQPAVVRRADKCSNKSKHRTNRHCIPHSDQAANVNYPRLPGCDAPC